jgi:hypothetical protein
MTIKTETFKFKDGRYLHKLDVKVAEVNGRLYFHFPFSRPFMAEIKAMEGSKWHGPVGDRKPLNPEITLKLYGTTKIWSVENTARNQFQLDFLFGRNPYERYDRPLVPFTATRPLYAHQCELAAFALTRHYCIFAAEMGTGKTLAAIEVMEQSGVLDWWYIAPRSALKAVERELKIWKCKINPRMETYDALRSDVASWLSGKAPPQGIIFDESSRIKNYTAKRSQAAKAMADGIRHHWGEKGFVILMSGSPAPKSPVDWWHQCEVAQPGFLREGTVDKFQLRLGIFKQQESIAGGVFQQRVTWLDDDKKCMKCGLPETDMTHDQAVSTDWHAFIPSVNEVHNLYKRMGGLVTVKFKRDCLDLPEKIYREIICKPLPETLRAAKLIAAKAPNTISAMTLLRELSDGFQYIEVKEGKQKCEVCHGTRKYIEGTAEQLQQQADANAADFEIKEIECPYCDENGETDRLVRKIQEVKCPKDDALKDLLTDHDEVGRIVIYGGFSGSVDRCVNLALGEEWSVIRVDGRGWWQVDSKRNPLIGDPLSIFQDLKEDHPRVAFIGQPGAAGMGLTLTASPSIVYFSNDFNAESRIQSEDRIHRPGMDVNRGATIYDLLHLPTDRTVLDNLRAKRQLQDMTLGALNDALLLVGDERLF